MWPPCFVQLPQGGYDHYMQKEIHEQPKSLTDTMRGRLVIVSARVCMHASTSLHECACIRVSVLWAIVRQRLWVAW
jgi:glucosamine--fructose-6-phosphate aminotransferase (isomerizing)